VPAMADLISSQIDQHGAENVSVFGDSAGGGIALAAVQELVRRGDPVPSHMVLSSPGLDQTLSNPAIQFVDDPVLSSVVLPDLHNYAQLWAGGLDLTDPLVSPLYGSLAGLPPTAVYAGSRDIVAPDVLVLQDKALATPGADFTFILRKGEFHDWAIVTILPETIAVLPDIYQQLGIGSDVSLSSPNVKLVASPTTNGLVIDTPMLSGQSMDPALTGEAPPLAGVSALTVDPLPNATAEPATFTGEPSIVSQVLTGVFRVVRAVGDFLGVDLTIPLAQLLSSDSPPWITTLGLNVQRSEFEGMPVWTLQSPGSTSDETVVAIHGGAFVAHVNIFNWLNYAAMARDTGATVIVPIYPLVPQGGTAGTVVPAMADLISAQIDQHGAENVSVYGDSAGGYLALAAVQELVRRRDPVPSHMVLISPPLDLTLSNPAIQFVDDPLFSGLLPTLHNIVQQWAGDLDLTDPLVSPLYGSLAGLPPTAVYFGSLEIFAPDGLVLQDKALATPGADFTFILRKGELHDWPTVPILPETIAVLPDIYHQLGIGSDASPTLSGQSMDVSDAVRSPQLREARS
jgi:triacylglycerol lipase